MQADDFRSRHAQFFQDIGYLLWAVGIGFVVLFVGFAGGFAAWTVYCEAWKSVRPEHAMQHMELTEEWMYLVCGLLIYGWMAWPRLGGVFAGVHITILSVISAIYLDHIEHLREIYLRSGAHPWAAMPPAVGALPAAAVAIGAVAFWYRGQFAIRRVGLRTLLVVMLLTAVVLAGWNELARRELRAKTEHFERVGAVPGYYPYDGIGERPYSEHDF
jgi:hypothetical protein